MRLLDQTILLTVAGSRAYGMHTEESDVDLKGIAVPSRAILHGFVGSFKQADKPEDMALFEDLLTDDERDATRRTKLEGSIYGVQKFARLAMDCNPHCLDALFCRQQEVRLQTEGGRLLRESADAFLSRRARHSFGGYAAAQLKRIKTHRRWLLSPVTARPVRSDFDLPPMPVIPKEQIVAASAAIRKQLDHWELDLSGVPGATIVNIKERISEQLAELQLGADERWLAAARWVGLHDNFIELMAKERRYKAAMSEFRQYNQWRTMRNPARAALEAAHGYDTKHGTHLVRLLSMAIEIVGTGKVHVWRGDRDAEELLAIRAGGWSYEKLIQWTESAEQKLRELTPTSPLPQRCDAEKLNRLVVRVVELSLALEPAAPASSLGL